MSKILFEPGKTGNPGGAPKKVKRFQGALLRAIGRRYEGVEHGLDKIADKLLREAEMGKNPIAAIKEIRDTLDGKPAQALEHSGDVTMFTGIVKK